MWDAQPNHQEEGEAEEGRRIWQLGIGLVAGAWLPLRRRPQSTGDGGPNENGEISDVRAGPQNLSELTAASIPPPVSDRTMHTREHQERQQSAQAII
jgi:hypothetical protein